MSLDRDPIPEPITEFVEYESRDRFQVVDVPTDLFEWVAPYETIGSEGAKNNNNISRDEDERKEKFVQCQWSQYENVLCDSGYRSLIKLRDRIDGHLEQEIDRYRKCKYRVDQIKPLLDFFRTVADELGEEATLGEVIDSKGLSDGDLPLLWSITLQHSESETSDADSNGNVHGEISPLVKGISAREYDPPSVDFSGTTRLTDICDELQGKLGRAKRRAEGARDTKELLRVRLQVLRKFLWTYETAGSVVDPHVTRVPNLVSNNPTRLAHTLRILEILPELHEDGQPLDGEWPTFSTLQTHIAEHFDREDYSSKQAVTEGAAQLFRELFPRQYEGSPDFYELLLEHKDEVEEWAEEEGVEI